MRVFVSPKALIAMVFCVTALASFPAQAGKVAYANGQARWIPTGCATPVRPAMSPNNPETPADDLNARIAEYNAYVMASSDYMDCVSKEAQHDAQAFGEMIVNSAQKIINENQTDVESFAKSVHAKPATSDAQMPALQPLTMPGSIQ